MEKDYVLRAVGTIRDQLVAVTPIGVIRSWHIDKFVATEYKGMTALRFHVNGEAFSGNVIVALEGQDCYGVYLQNYSGTKHVKDGVYFMELGEVIDRAVKNSTGKICRMKPEAPFPFMVQKNNDCSNDGHEDKGYPIGSGNP